MSENECEQENAPMNENETLRKLTFISDKTGVSTTMIRYLLSTLPEGFRKFKTLSSEQIVRGLIQNLIETQQSVEKVLEGHGIHSGLDVGLVVIGLCENGLLVPDEDDSLEGYDNIFTTSKIEQYIKNEGLKKRKVLSFWIGSICVGIGIVIIITSYKELLPKDLGSWGWILALVGCVLIYLGNLSKKDKVVIS
ncbi:MAG: hypothetical protein ACI8ZM_003954 [Crocinitomix sp.]|jgi:hypothetical protein